MVRMRRQCSMASPLAISQWSCQIHKSLLQRQWICRMPQSLMKRQWICRKHKSLLKMSDRQSWHARTQWGDAQGLAVTTAYFKSRRARRPPTTPHARCARNLEASQTQCDDPEPTVPRNLEAALDEEATIAYGSLAKDLFADDQPEAPACTCRFAALLDIAVTTAIGITGSWQYTIPLSI